MQHLAPVWRRGQQESMTFARFALVGGTGFVIDAGVMTMLHELVGRDIVESRLWSFATALLATWLLNRSLTFRGAASKRRMGEFLRYALVGVSGALVNFVVFIGLVRHGPAMLAPPLVALAGAAIVAMFVTYTGNRILVFPGVAPDVAPGAMHEPAGVADGRSCGLEENPGSDLIGQSTRSPGDE